MSETMAVEWSAEDMARLRDWLAGAVVWPCTSGEQGPIEVVLLGAPWQMDRRVRVSRDGETWEGPTAEWAEAVLRAVREGTSSVEAPR